MTGLPEGLTARAPTMDDVEAVTALVAACQVADQGLVDIDADDVRSDWQRPSFDLERDCVLVLDGERLVGRAEVFGARAEVSVRQDRRGRAIGTWLLGWTERRAMETGSPRIGQTLSDGDTTAVAFLTRHGYAQGHSSWVLRIHHDGPPPPPEPPGGIRIRDLVAERDDEAAFELIDGAFAEWPGRDPSTFGDWSATTIRRPGFEPWHLPLAVEEDEVVGAAFLIPYPGEGWIQQLAVKSTHRRRGIARALLQHAFGALYARGMADCGLSTNSLTGALGLYERVGMRVTRSYTHYAKEL